MVEQPVSTVTLVFTDIEGSTKLLPNWAKTGTGRPCLRTGTSCAARSHEGYEVDYEGDAFIYAFASAVSAVSAVTETIDGLGSSPIRIRVGIHTGQPGLDPPKYVGLDVPKPRGS